MQPLEIENKTQFWEMGALWEQSGEAAKLMTNNASKLKGYLVD